MAEGNGSFKISFLMCKHSGSSVRIYLSGDYLLWVLGVMVTDEQ